MSRQIAIDGPAGAGKSTIAKEVSRRLGFLYVDTGAMYRAMGLYLIREGVDTDNEEEVNARLDGADIRLKLVDGVQHVYLNGEDVSTAIRTEEAGMMASKTSAYGKVREKLVSLQQQIAASEDVVMDGRDIGTVVLPNAGLKIFLTASVDERARRRYKELIGKGQEADYESIRADIAQRDYQDTHREISPLRQAEDAVYLDTSEMGVEEVTAKVISLAEKI